MEIAWISIGKTPPQAVAGRDCPHEELQPWRGAEFLCGHWAVTKPLYGKGFFFGGDLFFEVVVFRWLLGFSSGVFFVWLFFLLVFVIYLCKPWCIDRYWQNRWRLYLPDLNWRTLNFSFKSPRSKRGEDVSGARSFGRCSRCFCGYGARKLETVFQAVIRIPVPSRELNGTNISPTKIYKGTFEDEVLFPRWDMLPSWRMYRYMFDRDEMCSNPPRFLTKTSYPTWCCEHICLQQTGRYKQTHCKVWR